MTAQNYLIIQNNVVTNTVMWDGNTQSWTPPSDAVALVCSTTPTKLWGVVDTEVVLVDSVGDADIGFTYDGTYCITNQPKPEAPTPAPNQPESSGTVNI